MIFNPAYVILLIALICAVASLAQKVHPSVAVLLLIVLELFRLSPAGK